MINQALLEQAEHKIRREYTALDTIIITKNATPTYSNVFNAECALNKPQLVYSVTKSITAALVGIAINKGYIKSVNQTLAQLLPVHSKNSILGAGVDQITLHQLLSMTTGQPWNNGGLRNEPMLTRVFQQPDWLTSLLRLPVKTSLMGQFQYNTGLSHILSAIISNTTNSSAEQFAKEHLFTPMDIDNYHWPVDPQGHNTGGWGLHLTPVDMAKFGQLFLSQGLHEGRQLIPTQWITACTTAHTSDYGYHWWLKSSQGMDCWCAMGLGGQTICCIPKLDAVIVTTSQFAGRRKNLWTLIDKYWVPAVM